MRKKQLFMSAIAILALGSVVLPTTADAKDGGHVRRVRLQDNCDPATFDAAIAPGTCLPHGNGRTVTFAEFLTKLNPQDFGHREWNFKPANIELNSGDSIRATVRGGEVHTFTEVNAFGAGCVPFINAALGLNGPPAADCSQLGASAASPGHDLNVSGLMPGEHLFMCLIHPWMRAMVDVHAKD